MLDIANIIYKEYSENYSSDDPKRKDRQDKEFAALKALTNTLLCTSKIQLKKRVLK